MKGSFKLKAKFQKVAGKVTVDFEGKSEGPSHSGKSVDCKLTLTYEGARG